MQALRRIAVCGLALAAGSVAALAQSAVISARSGLIHYIEGDVYLGDQQIESKFGSFPEVKENQTLRTAEGPKSCSPLESFCDWARIVRSA